MLSSSGRARPFPRCRGPRYRKTRFSTSARNTATKLPTATIGMGMGVRWLRSCSSIIVRTTMLEHERSHRTPIPIPIVAVGSFVAVFLAEVENRVFLYLGPRHRGKGRARPLDDNIGHALEAPGARDTSLCTRIGEGNGPHIFKRTP